ncbi:MAG: DUF3854 domain-containing protein [Cyanobacteriota bacterium]|nr:DUF3854 domain-containing protein [Cyanobacteriota bacterium]
MSLEGQAPYERLFYSDSIKRLNTGRLPGWILKKYSHIETGGWWSNGIDPLTGEDDLWGCFKADQPRIDTTKGKYQKYEHPLKAAATLFALRVPLHVWQTVSKRYNVPMPENVVVDDRGEALGFWDWVIANPKVSVTVTEGVKKAAALLSLGFAAIGLPGIWGGYRKNDGKPCLLPQLEIFAQGERQFYFAFDQDEKRKTRQANRKALWCTAKLLVDKGCKVSIIGWEPMIKGCDDLIVAKGGNYFVECYLKALSFDDWQADGLRELSYKPALRLDSSTKYIGEFCPPLSAKLICLKAPKGSGKTEWLVKICADAQNRGQKVIVITHRQQLGQALCSRFGIDYVSELKDSDTKGAFGFGLCFDSLRRNSQARFNPDDWHGCILILDECEQSLWHLLSARTEVSAHRVQVLRNFQELIQNTLESEEGKVYLSDADLSDLSIDYVRSLANFPVEPWVAVKEGNPTPWDVTVWESSHELLGVIASHIRMEGRLLIFVDGQKAKSKWGTQNLENYLLKLFPELRILRIDAESIADPNHPAFGCIDKLNQVLPLYDVAIASPSIETGVSIDIKGHFTAVFDISQGVIPVPSVLQRMARLREPVPRHIWAKNFGMGRIGNGSSSPKKLMASQQTQFKAHVKLLAESDFPDDFEAATSFQPQSLHTWAKMAARINQGMVRYRHEILRALVAEGHSIQAGDYNLDTDEEADGLDKIKEDLGSSRDNIYQRHCYDVSQSPNPDDDRYKYLTKKQSRTKEELRELRKGELSRRYCEQLVNMELVKLDDEGEYSKARLHYHLTIGRKFLPDRDKQVMERQLHSGEGELFLPDVNRSLMGGKIKFLEALGIHTLLQQDTEWTNDSQVLIDLSIKSRQFADSIKSVLGVAIKEEDSPVAIAQKFLRQSLGLAFSTPVKRGAKGNQQRYYQPVEIPELRQKTLETWLARDEAAAASQQAAEAALRSLTTPDACPPIAVNQNMGVESVAVSLDSDVEVGSTGNIYRSPVLPTESAAYQSAAYQHEGVGSELEQLLEALPFAESAEDFASIVDGSPTEAVEEAIALQPNQPRRQQLTQWLEALNQPVAASSTSTTPESQGERSLLARLTESLAYCRTPKDLFLVLEGLDATTQQVEEAIALQDDQPRRQQLSQWWQSLSSSKSTAVFVAAGEVVNKPIATEGNQPSSDLPPLDSYQQGDAVWFWHPMSKEGWVKGVVRWVRDCVLRVEGQFFGNLIERADQIAPGNWLLCPNLNR